MSVRAAWSGWPSQRPLRRSVTGGIGRKSADSQRWLKSPNGCAQPSLHGDESSEQTGHLRYLHDEYPQLVHNVGNFGDKNRSGLPRSSWISPLWPQAPARTFRLARRGRYEPPDRSGERSSGRSREPGSRAARPASEGPGGDRRLRTCSEPADPSNGRTPPVPSGAFVCPTRRGSTSAPPEATSARLPRVPDPGAVTAPSPPPSRLAPSRTGASSSPSSGSRSMVEGLGVSQIFALAAGLSAPRWACRRPSGSRSSGCSAR